MQDSCLDIDKTHYSIYNIDNVPLPTTMNTKEELMTKNDTDRREEVVPAQGDVDTNALQQHYSSTIVTTSGVDNREPTTLNDDTSKGENAFPIFEDELFASIIADCTAEDFEAIKHLKSPKIFHDPMDPDAWIVVDTLNTVADKNFIETKAGLERMGLELLNYELFKEENIDCWTWIIDRKRDLEEVGVAWNGDRERGIPYVSALDIKYKNPELGGRGLRRIRKKHGVTSSEGVI